MKIKKILVTNLFNVFTHSIDLNLDDHITILHGPNGFGKTVILRMLDGLFNTRYGIFRTIPFDSLLIEFTDGRTIRIAQLRSEDDEGRKDVDVILYGPDETDEPFNLSAIDRDKLPVPINALEDIINEISQVGPREWIDRVQGDAISLEEVLDRYAHYLPDLSYKIPSWLRSLRDEMPVHLIQTERLVLHKPRSRFRSRIERLSDSSSTVVVYSKELANTIQDSLAESVEFSSSLDRSFPSRLMNLIKRGDAPELDENELRIELAELDKKHSRLTRAGLLERGQVAVDIPDESLSPETLKVLSMYVRDVRQKLNLFDHDLKKIELIQQMINRRFLYKEFDISKQEGFVFRTTRGNILSPSSLSSGEQHEIVILYELLFKTKPNSLILIDEPEISLHIAWQQLFLKDLVEITKIAEFDAIVATHSPDIISDRWDLTVELLEPSENQQSDA